MNPLGVSGSSLTIYWPDLLPLLIRKAVILTVMGLRMPTPAQCQYISVLYIESLKSVFFTQTLLVSVASPLRAVKPQSRVIVYRRLGTEKKKEKKKKKRARFGIRTPACQLYPGAPATSYLCEMNSVQFTSSLFSVYYFLFIHAPCHIRTSRIKKDIIMVMPLLFQSYLPK